jgi:hypothetical protein
MSGITAQLAGLWEDCNLGAIATMREGSLAKSRTIFAEMS